MEYTKGNAFDIFPETEDDKPNVGNIVSRLCHWVFDPLSDDLYLQQPAVEIDADNEFVRCDDRYMGHKGRYIFGAYHDKSPGKTDWKFVSQKIGGECCSDRSMCSTAKRFRRIPTVQPRVQV